MEVDATFWAQDYYEVRNDDPNLVLYSVVLANKRYILCYDKDQLREVYFMKPLGNRKYFMSCRADFSIVSHYYISLPYILRYEAGKLNRTYTMRSPTVTVCQVGDTERVYTLLTKHVAEDLKEKFYIDLTTFLAEFNKRGFNTLFSPVRPLD